jgi:hypothetical protein
MSIDIWIDCGKLEKKEVRHIAGWLRKWVYPKKNAISAGLVWSSVFKQFLL